MSKIAEGLKRLFEKHRIVLWYDAAGDFVEEFDGLELPGVEKCFIENNEFALKYRILIVEPTTRFLLYAKHEHPRHEENWLLDIELSNTIFHTDKEALTLQELDLPMHYKPWITKHFNFFKNKERISRFKNIIEGKDNEEDFTIVLLQITTGSSSGSLDDILKGAVTAMLAGRSEQLEKDLQNYQLSDYFWNWVASVYNYNIDLKSIYDFILEVFQKNFSPMAEKASVNRTAEVLLASWKDAKSFEKTYKILISKVEEDLDIRSRIADLSLEELQHDDLFECIEKQIITEISIHIENETLSSERIESYIKKRESCYWYNRYFEFYHALRLANRILAEISGQSSLNIEDFQDGFEQYTKKWYLIDQYYRKFIQHYKATNQNNVLNPVYNKVHKAYSNTWLLKLSSAWQDTMQSSQGWYFGIQSQRQFFKQAVKHRYIDKNITIFVVISDALRYECGQELHELFEQEYRFDSKLEYLITGLPSYTQLGMAALLPHSKLSFGEVDTIVIDGKNSTGIQARKKVLEEGSMVKSTTIRAEELMNMASRSEDARKLVQDHQVVYVYHNRIDKLGDDKNSEDQVIEAAKDEIQFLLEVTRKITNMNANHVIITSDHGFIYQNEPLEECDFTDAQIAGDIVKESRRFVLGKNLEHNNNVIKYSSTDLKINSDLEILIPKGINRLRRQGAGSRYVHGGATLQEVVVPLLYVVKKRSDTVSKVDVDILKGSNRITTNIQRVRFFQQQPVGDGIVARSVKSYFCIIEGEDKKVISDLFYYTFDSGSKRSEEREVEFRFTISTAVRKSNSVYLMIEEQVEKSNQWNTLLKIPYSLNLAMENDFDDF